MRCWVCNAELIWGGAHDIEPFDEEDYSIVTNLSCPECDAFVEVYHGKSQEQVRINKEKNIYGKVVSNDLKEKNTQ